MFPIVFATVPFPMMESIKSITDVLHNSFKMAEIVLAELEKGRELCQYLSSESEPMSNPRLVKYVLRPWPVCANLNKANKGLWQKKKKKDKGLGDNHLVCLSHLTTETKTHKPNTNIVKKARLIQHYSATTSSLSEQLILMGFHLYNMS